MKKIQFMILLIGIAIILVITGCHDVRVIDSQGNPVAGAEVRAVSFSMNTGPAITNADGWSSLPTNIQGTRWIEIRYQGRIQQFVLTQTPITLVFSDF